MNTLMATDDIGPRVRGILRTGALFSAHLQLSIFQMVSEVHRYGARNTSHFEATDGYDEYMDGWMAGKISHTGR